MSSKILMKNKIEETNRILVKEIKYYTTRIAVVDKQLEVQDKVIASNSDASVKMTLQSQRAAMSSSKQLMKEFIVKLEALTRM